VTARESFELQGPVGRLVGTTTPTKEGTVPVVLVHGINMSSDVWADVVPLLADGRQVITLDLRGHGESDHVGPYDAGSYADDVLAVLDHLGIDGAHVVGTSFGGTVACAIANGAPARATTIAAVGSALVVEGLDIDAAVEAIRAVGVRDFFAGFMPQASFAPGVDQALLDRALDSASNGRSVDTVIDVATAALTADNRALATGVKAPALVVTGEVDMTCPVPFGQAMAEALGVEHVVVPGRGHVLSMEDPDGLATLLTEHFARHEQHG
jgi:pimeloyl-ACP methyl ester carboxylesterase